MRNFIVDGLQAAHPQAAVSSAPYEIKRLRERKSPAEIELMKCVNEVSCNSVNPSLVLNPQAQATILSIRAVRKRLYFGIRESEARAMMQATFASAGLKDGGCLVLFGGTQS
jgi:Xaa-Pro aminopeptidase